MSNENKYQQFSSMDKEELEKHFKKTVDNIGKSMYKLRLSNKNVSHQLREDNYIQKNSIVNFENLEITEYYIDEFFYNYKIFKEKISNARLAKIALDEKNNTAVINNTNNISQELLLLGCQKIKLDQ